MKQIVLKGTPAQIYKWMEMIMKKYGKDTPIAQIADDPFLWVEP